MFKQELYLMFMDQRKRLNVMRYFAYQGFLYFIFFLCAVILFAVGYFLPIFYAIVSLALGIMVVILVILNVMWIIRRLNDLNFSGYWILVPVVFFLLTMFFAILPLPDDSIFKLILVFSSLFVTSVAYFALLILMFIPGTKGINDYGEEPENNNLFTYIFLVAYIIFIIVFAIASMLQPDKKEDNSEYSLLSKSLRKTIALNLKDANNKIKSFF